MQQVPAELSTAFERWLDQAQVPAHQRPDYPKWVRFYLDFWTKYGHFPALPTSLGPFLTKLASKTKMTCVQTVPSVTLNEAKSPLDCL